MKQIKKILNLSLKFQSWFDIPDEESLGNFKQYSTLQNFRILESEFKTANTFLKTILDKLVSTQMKYPHGLFSFIFYYISQ
jgi:hypothetical protein